jgi:membrane associated rhomboid family serine protease
LDRPEIGRRKPLMIHIHWTKRRIVWMVAMGLGGLLIGGKAGDPKGIALGLIWGASIGYGFGVIFDQEHATKTVLAYWAATLALIGIFFGLILGAGLRPEPSLLQETVAGAIGALAGAMLGLLIGNMRLRRLHRRSHPS